MPLDAQRAILLPIGFVCDIALRSVQGHLLFHGGLDGLCCSRPRCRRRQSSVHGHVSPGADAQCTCGSPPESARLVQRYSIPAPSFQPRPMVGAGASQTDHARSILEVESSRTAARVPNIGFGELLDARLYETAQATSSLIPWQRCRPRSLLGRSPCAAQSPVGPKNTLTPSRPTARRPLFFL